MCIFIFHATQWLQAWLWIKNIACNNEINQIYKSTIVWIICAFVFVFSDFPNATLSFMFQDHKLWVIPSGKVCGLKESGQSTHALSRLDNPKPLADSPGAPLRVWVRAWTSGLGLGEPADPSGISLETLIKFCSAGFWPAERDKTQRYGRSSVLYTMIKLHSLLERCLKKNPYIGDHVSF